ncbi:transmembrane protein, putative (macronuclear) [Tetrahymena thermophila SB210]|uniref:Transmembrane protein, putative n=1 Tax=Tetrahymena thermophila (strain SB210) TaxID=312017 RepID=W7XFU7_TETTS|nr:transmembrane protein, putative [Tetrahymena thermophila SB210]EWS75748.1 transmembrane protein, putative [Tetrahymena thermophila SB210]|eukprot:XP_012651670.1 transmembrane protein, putative [Tetrahymena thermophila SB210]
MSLIQKVKNFNFNKHTLSYNQPIYGTDDIKVGLLNNELIKDPLFGISTQSKDSYGLERRLEMYQQDKWVSSPLFKIQFIANDIKLGNVDITDINLDKITQESIRLNIDQNQINQAQLDYTKRYQGFINNYFIPSVRSKYERQFQYDQEDMEILIEEIDELNKKFQGTKRMQVSYDQNFIYYTQEQNKFQQGDFRVSFYELKPYSQISVFTNKLKKRYIENQDSDFYLGREYNKIQLHDFEVILPGNVSQLELIQYLIQNLEVEMKQGELQLVQKSSQNNNNNKNNQFTKSEFLNYSLLCAFLFYYYYNFSLRLELDSFSSPLLMTFIHSCSIRMLVYGIINVPTALFTIGGSYIIQYVLSNVLNNQESQVSQYITQINPNIIAQYQQFQEIEKRFINMLQEGFSN